jgi:S-adenosylmethionine:tRNA ribosyltransferase-isomerase
VSFGFWWFPTGLSSAEAMSFRFFFAFFHATSYVMKLSDLQFDYPAELIATSPSRPSRVLWAQEGNLPEEITIAELISRIPRGDALVINDTKVLKRRVFSENETEILFLDKVSESENSNRWQVLFPSKKYSVGSCLSLPNGVNLKLIEKGRPQIVEVSPAITDDYFAQYGELPLPPYIQKARNSRHNTNDDKLWYQTDWAENAGSMAAPTASLHFTNGDLEALRQNGVAVITVTLHVGLGTFLPVTVEDLSDHKMHSEVYEIHPSSWNMLNQIRTSGGKVWALGTTSTRALESAARTEILFGQTDILIKPGTEFLMVDRLLTNFHQPESTLLALVSAFTNLERVKGCYSWAIHRKFKLFSYGDLSVWIR